MVVVVVVMIMIMIMMTTTTTTMICRTCKNAAHSAPPCPSATANNCGRIRTETIELLDARVGSIVHLHVGGDDSGVCKGDGK